MSKVNFVPDDYIQNSQSRRTNMMYVVLFTLLMVALGSVFMTIKVRQCVSDAMEKRIDTQLAQKREDITRIEQIQSKRKQILKTALTTVDLLEPVPRSVLLASLTNNLPQGVSFLNLSLVQKESKRKTVTASSNYEKAKDKKAKASMPRVSKEKLLDTLIDIEGVAPSDLQVAFYIENLNNSYLLDNVTLVESKEHKIKGTTFRQFKLKAMLRRDAYITDERINKISVKNKKIGKG